MSVSRYIAGQAVPSGVRRSIDQPKVLNNNFTFSILPTREPINQKFIDSIEPWELSTGPYGHRGLKNNNMSASKQYINQARYVVGKPTNITDPMYSNEGVYNYYNLF